MKFYLDIFFLLVYNPSFYLIMNNNYIMQNAGIVFSCEVLVDVIKHAFLAKFNEIKPSAYSDFLLSLCEEVIFLF